MSKPRPAFKLWLETEKGYVFGPGVYNLLKNIEEKGTLKEASQVLGMSYRYAWGLIREAEQRLGEPLIDASKGGRRDGGSTEITDLGREFVQDFENLRLTLAKTFTDRKIISDNQVIGIIEDIEYNKENVIITIQLNKVKVKFIKTDLDFEKGSEMRFKLILEYPQPDQGF